MMAVVPGTVSAQTSKLANEFSSFTLNSRTSVSYGANGVLTSKTLDAGSYVCGNTIFGDPVMGVAKACYAPAATANATTTNMTTTTVGVLAAENGTFKLASASVVAYGANGTMVQKSLAAGTYSCGNALFGDPLMGVFKSCYSTAVAAPAPSTNQLALIVKQRSSFTLTAATTVVYGAGAQTVQKVLAAGTYQCSDEFFGDPAVGIQKGCYAASTVVAAPVVVAPVLAAPVLATPVANKPSETSGSVLAVSGDVMVNGAVSNAEYQAMAQKMGTDAAIAYRYGPSSADYGTASQGGLPS
ncbi:MAG: hypothetical protein EOP70_09940, partial [Variovorax sp.]